MTDDPLSTPGPDRIVLAGDWDGNIHRACEVIEYAAARGIGIVVQLGDFGFGTDHWATSYLDAVESTCATCRVTVLFLDGNHEHFPALHAVPIDANTGLRTISPHVHHLPRGLRWVWHDTRWMALGGAHSVDRPDRSHGVSWWPEEHLTDGDIAAAIAPGVVDVIVSHDAPAGVCIPGLTPHAFSAREISTSGWHRDRVSAVVDATEPALLFHGHYHVRYSARRGATMVIGVADDSAALADNIIVLTLAGNRIGRGRSR